MDKEELNFPASSLLAATLLFNSWLLFSKLVPCSVNVAIILLKSSAHWDSFLALSSFASFSEI